MTIKRLLLGLVVMVLIQSGVDYLLSSVNLLSLMTGSPGEPGAVQLTVALQAAISAFIGAFAGGWVARRGFVLPAVLLWLAFWSVGVYLLYRIAAPAGQSSVLGIIQFNLVAMILSGAATALGAVLGQSTSGRRAMRPAAAT